MVLAFWTSVLHDGALRGANGRGLIQGTSRLHAIIGHHPAIHQPTTDSLPHPPSIDLPIYVVLTIEPPPLVCM